MGSAFITVYVLFLCMYCYRDTILVSQKKNKSCWFHIKKMAYLNEPMHGETKNRVVCFCMNGTYNKMCAMKLCYNKVFQVLSGVLMEGGSQVL